SLGVVVAYCGVQGLVAVAPPDTPLLSRIRVDGLTLAATLGFSLVASCLSGCFSKPQLVV
ncbi:MAG: hypothetical protein ACREXY_20875, partial [Gammaproteobacteria bacterium]